jgi:hypothetical protein
MAETLAKYSFLPFVRLGLGNQITEQDSLGNHPHGSVVERPEIGVSFRVKASDGESSKEEEVSRIVKIEGPGDVLGIQSNQIIRVHPAKGVDDFETTNLVYVEFYEEDFPWRFTPAKPSGNNLRPWLALLVLKTSEFIRNTQGGTPAPFIRILPDALQTALFPENELHHFAHVHALETLSENISNASNAADEIRAAVENNPDLALSRIICPRKLDGDTEYHAFLVPAYETGRLAGLGQPATGVIAQLPSWKRNNLGNNPFEIPYYYTWSFRTGSMGGFKELVTALEVRTFPGNTGREMDLSDIGYGIKPAGHDATALVEGAVKSISHVTPPWPVDEPDLQQKLKEMLNLNQTLQKEMPTVPSGNFYSPNEVNDPIITPPVYGRWHAFVDTLTNKNDWVHQLNLHPSHRAAAGLGTRVVQEHQEEFMEMAWNQIGPINEANQRIIENEAVKRSAERLFRKNLKKMDRLTLMNTLGNAMDVISVGNMMTAKKQLSDSRVPTGLRSGAFIRIANNFTQTALMTPSGEDGAARVLDESLIFRTDADAEPPTGETQPLIAISAAPKRKCFEMEADPVKVKQAIEYVVANPPPSFLLTLCNAIAAKYPNISAEQVESELPDDYTDDQKERASDIMKNAWDRGLMNGVLTLTVLPRVFRYRISKNYDSGEFQISGGPVNGITTVCLAKGHDLPETIFSYSRVLDSRSEFRNNFVNAYLNHDGTRALAFIRKSRQMLNAGSFMQSVLYKFKPGVNFLRKLSAFIEADAINKGKPLMAYPRFPIPVYDYLKEISPDYIIPNISNIPENTIAIMKPNKAFVESFLAGMNHEFSRELLWREFPTDMRGSYFRHFWEYDNDPSQELLPQNDETEAAFNQRVIDFQDGAVDVRELHQWNEPLGNNHKREIGLLLLIKGQLFRKYPDTLVYAQKARFGSAPANKLPRELTDFETSANVKWPIITGMIEPDVYFFGFDLSKTAAKGNSSNNPGWFFVIRERPGQISFGLDDTDSLPGPPEQWEDLAWQHLSNNAQILPQFLKISEAPFTPKTMEGVSWGTSGANMAYILYRSPVLFAKHASVFL